MTKGVIVFFVLLAIGVFIIGCQPDRAEPFKAAEQAVSQDALLEVVAPKIELNEPEQINIEIEIEANEVQLQTEAEANEAAIEKSEPNELEPAVDAATAFHDRCASILNNFVDDKGMVDYRLLKRKKGELKYLLAGFAALDRAEYNSWPKEDRMAFWLNAYNIQILKIIVDNYPIQSNRFFRLIWSTNSIRHIQPTSIIGTSKWDKYKFLVMDEQFTLLEIEERFFRKEFKDPRLFFALSGACLSSPPMRNEPYYGRSLDEQLDDQIKKFLSNPLAFNIDREKEEVYFSSLFESQNIGSEFIAKYSTEKKFKDQTPVNRAVLNFLTDYLSKPDATFLEVGNYSIEPLKHNWRLNE